MRETLAIALLQSSSESENSAASRSLVALACSNRFLIPKTQGFLFHAQQILHRPLEAIQALFAQQHPHEQASTNLFSHLRFDLWFE